MPASDIEDALRNFLAATPEVAALVGSGAEARIYPEVAPQDELRDHITFQVISDVRQGHLAGQIALSNARIQVDCWAKANAAAKSLASAVRKAKGGMPQGRELDGFEGRWDGVRVQKCIVDDNRSDPVPPTHGEESPFRRRMLELRVAYEIP